MASLRTISFDALRTQDASSIQELLDSAVDQGFFYLDLQCPPTKSILSDVQACTNAASRLYDLPLEEKLKYDIDKLGAYKLNGYKPAGRNQGISQGKKDGFEAYLIPRDGICHDLPDGGRVILPSPLATEQSLFERIMNDLHKVGQVVLTALSHHTALRSGVDLAQFHRPKQASTCAFGMLKYPQLWLEGSELGHGAHTDVGSLTFLFCSAPGLQILEPTTNQWAYVEPRPGHAIVNVGDSLRFLTKGIYRSCLHRVVPYKEQKIADRYSCAYFLRPEFEAVLTDDEGRSWRSIDWHDRKYFAFRATIDQQKESSVLTGKDGYIGLWQAVAVQHQTTVAPIS